MKSKCLFLITIFFLSDLFFFDRVCIAQSSPNFIIIFTDDQGYNDLGCFGSELIRTPNLDKMASEGMRFTTFYAQTVCGPSRGALMTGRYPLRVGGGWVVNSQETTIAEVLKTKGYTTGCIGKWDMSARKPINGLVPNDQGFDYYFGTLGANDEGTVRLYRNKEDLGETDNMASLTKMYTDEAINFIKINNNNPFFLYLAHSMPHRQIDASPQFKGKSNKELYGDVIEEIDWNVGRLLDSLENYGIAKNTFIIYCSDNGPWTGWEAYFRTTHDGQLATGCSTPLRSSKGSAYEGGFRVPCIMRWTGKIPANSVNDAIISTLDILPTFAFWAGAAIPNANNLDGYNQAPLILGETSKSARDTFYYHVKNELHAIRVGNWKIMLPDRENYYSYTGDKRVRQLELYNVGNDISERYNVVGQYPEIAEKLLKIAEFAPNDPHLKAVGL